MVTRRDCSAITKKTRYRWSPASVSHLDGEQIAGRESLPVRLQERLPGHAPAPLGSRVDPVVVQDPLHRGPSDLVAEVRERPADPCVPPLGILDRHPDHEHGHVTSRHRPASTAAGAAVVCLGDQSPVPAENRARRNDAGDLHQDAPSEFLAAHGESTALGIGQAKRPRAQVLPEDPILLPRRTRFSSRRYAIRSSWGRFTQPANVRTRNCSAGGMA